MCVEGLWCWWCGGGGLFIWVVCLLIWLVRLWWWGGGLFIWVVRLFCSCVMLGGPFVYLAGSFVLFVYGVRLWHCDGGVVCGC